jgi:hypothetical protein
MCASFAAAAETVSGLSSVSKDVSLTYTAVSEDKDTIVYSADVTWTDVTFAYNAGTTKWNPEKHDYSASGDSAKWSDSKGSVKVTNHSNAAIAVTVSFAKASTANGTATVSVSNGSFTLATGAGVTYAKAASNTATLTASGKPTSNATIGTLTVKIAAAT